MIMGLDFGLGNLVAGVFISLVGLAVLMYGRKEIRVPHMVAGAILVVFPYFVGLWWLALLIAAVVLAALALISRLGW
jgi:hypothetical protein